MKRIILSCLLPLCLLFSAFSQRSESEIALREYFIDAEFFLAQEFYLDALNDYLQVYKRGYEDNANINYRIGICYLNIPGQKDKSIEYFLKARQSASKNYKESTLSEKNAPIDVHLYLGNAYRVNNMLKEAIESYNTYKKLLPEDELNLHKYVDQQIEACNLANEFMQDPIDMEFVNLGEMINSSNDDYKAVMSGDGNTLVYMHHLPFYDAVYVSRKVDEAWTKPENITPQIMSDGDQFITCISYDGNTILLTKEDEFNSDIYISRYVDNRWEVSAPLGPNINTKYWESHASLSMDGNTLFFASNRNGGAGEMDIYYSRMTEEGIFGPARNITGLNTELNEDTPFVTDDGSMLFFSSQGFTSMGGYDIFVSHLGLDDSWDLPKNIGYPINTTDDDLFYYPVDNGNSALMARIQEDGFGGMDIYAINFNVLPEVLEKEIIPVPEPEEITEVIEEEKPVEELPVTVKEPEPELEPVEEPETKVAPPVVEKEITTVEIMPILFGFDKSILTEEGKKELDKVADLMKNNPALHIVLTGFTDPLGPESYNLRLSELRAKSALDYLVAKGVEGARIKAVGKGETEFIAVNTHPNGKDNPQGRRFNRRVEFEISGEHTTLVIKRIDPVPPELKIK